MVQLSGCYALEENVCETTRKSDELEHVLVHSITYAKMAGCCGKRLRQGKMRFSRELKGMFGSRYVLSVCFFFSAVPQIGRTAAPELEPLQGHWQVIELVIDGNVIPSEQIEYKLPSGGKIEIIDNAFIFRSPADGRQHARTFQVDATQYPSSILVTTAGGEASRGIYRQDGDNFVLCIAGPGLGQTPTGFAAPRGSGRMLMVLRGQVLRLRRRIPTCNPLPQLLLHLQPRTRLCQPRFRLLRPGTRLRQPRFRLLRPGTGFVSHDSGSPICYFEAPGPQLRVLNDSELAAALIGSWRHNDGEGILLVKLNGDGSFSTQREFQDTQVFRDVFVNTYVSSGRWQVLGGAVIFQVQSSTRVDKVNQTISMKVRTIDRNEVVYIDQLGRANRDVRVK